MKRRTFIQKSSLATFSALALTRCKMEEKYGPNDFGIQLWSVRREMEADAIATLKTIKEIGYSDVELAGYSNGQFYGMPPGEFKNILKDIGLKSRSAHVPLGWNAEDPTKTMSGDFESVCGDFKEVGVDFMVCPWMHDDGTIAKYQRLAELMNSCGETSKKHGIQFSYHNHDFEFVAKEGKVPYDVLLNETDKDKVDFELDLYWIKKGGADFNEYFKNHSGRFSLWHVKDMDDTEKAYFTEVGNGIIDWAPIFKEREASGMKLFYVEQDECVNYKPLESIKISHDYLKNLKV